MCVLGCIHAQQIEIDERGYEGMTSWMMKALPPSQKAMRSSMNHCDGGPDAILLGAPQPQHMEPPMGQHMGPPMGGHPGGPGAFLLGAPQSQQGPLMGGPVAVQVRCGNCRHVFGAPQQGMVAKCVRGQTDAS